MQPLKPACAVNRGNVQYPMSAVNNSMREFPRCTRASRLIQLFRAEFARDASIASSLKNACRLRGADET